jgi:hypothetical protein
LGIPPAENNELASQIANHLQMLRIIRRGDDVDTERAGGHFTGQLDLAAQDIWWSVASGQ